MKPETAQEREAEVHKSFPGLREKEDRDDPSPTPKEDGLAIYRELCRVGKFWKDGHGRVYYSRHVDGEDYRVGSHHKWRFPRFVGGLLNLRTRAARTREALDQIEERMRDQAPVGLLVSSDAGEIAQALASLKTTLGDSSLTVKPLKLAYVKRKRLGDSNKRSKRVRR